MNEKQKQWLSYALIVVAILVGFFGVRYPLPDAPGDIEHLAVGPTRFRSIQVDHDANVDGAITGAVTGDLTGDLTGDVTGDLTNSTFLNLTAQTAISVTAAGTITPTGTYQPLTSGSAVTTSTSAAVSDGSVTGALLLLENQNAADVIIVDGTGGNVECKADVALGAGDTLLLIWNGTDWYCLSGYDNS